MSDNGKFVHFSVIRNDPKDKIFLKVRRAAREIIIVRNINWIRRDMRKSYWMLETEQKHNSERMASAMVSMLRQCWSCCKVSDEKGQEQNNKKKAHCAMPTCENMFGKGPRKESESEQNGVLTLKCNTPETKSV